MNNGEQESQPTSDFEDKLVDMLDALQNGVATVGDKVLEYGPDVVEMALWVVRIDGMQYLLTGIVCAMTSALLTFKYLNRLWEWARKHDEGSEFMVTIVIFIISGLLTTIAIARLSNMWGWVAVFAPKLALAKKVVESAL